MNKADTMETYGDPHLHPGYYPIKSEYDNGGCNADYPRYANPLIEGYGNPDLNHNCYPQNRFQTMCNRDRPEGQVAVSPCSGGNALVGTGLGPFGLSGYGSGKGLVETYGDPHLHPGIYEDGSAYNSEGCILEPSVSAATCDDILRAKERKAHMEQRAGNNPFDFQEIPKYAQKGFIVGTGCMNSACHCKNCHGDCLCEVDESSGCGCGASPMGLIASLLSLIPNMTGNGLLDLIITIVIISFLIKKFKK